MYEIQHYLTHNERDLFIDWLEKLKDTTAKIAAVRRIARIEQGNFGDHKFFGMVCGSCVLMLAQGIEFITPFQENSLFCCYVVAIKIRNNRI